MSARLSARFSRVAALAASLLASPAAYAETAVSPPPFNFMNHTEGFGAEPTAGGANGPVMRGHGHYRHHHPYHYHHDY